MDATRYNYNMNLVERHFIKPNNNLSKEVSVICFHSKNLYNRALYITRQNFFDGIKFNASTLYHTIKNEEVYQMLPRKVGKAVLAQVMNSWSSFFGLLELYRQGGLEHSPSIPKYLKKDSRNVVTYDVQSFSKKALKFGYFNPSGTNIFIPIQHDGITKGGRIVPRNDGFWVEIIYEKEIEEYDLDYNLIAGIDLGIDNIIALTSNKQDFQSLVINGRGIKSVNQFYNKRKAEMQSKLPDGVYSSKAIHKLTDKRNNKINWMLHNITTRVISYLLAHKIGYLVVGRNKEWKQNINIGKRNNQNFTTIPHYKLIQMLQYKCEMVGIILVDQEESYTSKCSFLDNETIEKQENYRGKRIKRGLFKSGNGTLINADINGSLNIIRKAFPEAFSEGIEAISVTPYRVNFC